MLEKSFVKELRELSRSSSLRHEHKLVLVEGTRAISGAIDSGAQIQEIYFSDSANTPTFTKISSEKYVSVSEKVIAQITTTKNPQNVVALCHMPVSKPGALSNQKNIDKPIFILDNLNDPGNVGTIIRSAVAFGFAGIVVLGGVDPFNTKVIRSSAGTIFGLETVIVNEYELEGMLSERPIYATRADAKEELNEIEFKSNSAFVLGNEAHGIKGEYFEKNATSLRVNMEELCESLNVAMLATIVAHQMFTKKIKVK